MDKYVITIYNNQKELPIKGLRIGEKINLMHYECRHIYPNDWQIFKQFFPKKVFDPEITYFLDMGFEIRVYRKKIHTPKK